MKRLLIIFTLLAILPVSAAAETRKKQVYLTEAELRLLEQDGGVDLKKHPDPRALRREYFEMDLETEKRKVAAGNSQPGPIATVTQQVQSVAIETVLPTPTPNPTVTPGKKNKPSQKKELALSIAEKLGQKIVSGELNGAIEVAEKLARKNPELAGKVGIAVWQQWLQALLFKGDDSSAEDFLKLALVLNTGDVDAHEALGALYWRMSNDSASKMHYRKAFEMDPDRTYLENRLKR